MKTQTFVILTHDDHELPSITEEFSMCYRHLVLAGYKIKYRGTWHTCNEKAALMLEELCAA